MVNLIFESIAESRRFTLTNSDFIADIVHASAQVLFFPRARRFGKTMALSMLRYYFEKHDEERAYLFEGLRICQQADAHKHFQKYQVIFLTFKDVKFNNAASAFENLASLIASLYQVHGSAGNCEALTQEDKDYFQRVRSSRASLVALTRALQQLCQYLFLDTGQKVVLLVDECDTPIRAAFSHGYL